MTNASMPTPAGASLTWKTPAVVMIVGCFVAVIAFGPRSTLGFFMTPMLSANGWGRDLFAVAIAIQNLLWGIGQPFSGALADRFGTARVMWVGALLYAAGLALMSISTTPGMLNISAGVLIGFGLSGCSFPVVLAALGKVLPEEWRSLAFGAGTAAGSFGQFLYSPLAVMLMDSYGWQNTLLIFSVTLLLVLPFSLVIATKPMAKTSGTAVPQQSLKQALREALAHRSFVLLVLGYFTCGFQLQFVTIHLPPYLIDKGLTAQVGGWTIAVIGLFNIVGSLGSGYLSNIFPKRYVLSVIYFGRALGILAFIMFPVTPTTCILFGAFMGLLWLSTVPPTTSLIALMFGTRWLATLAGFAFFSHQVGGFLGVLIGGIAFERTGSYDLMWWLAILFGVLSALINLPIVEKPVVRAAAPASA
jgi:MFS family permease